jgi:hypothetical protein
MGEKLSGGKGDESGRVVGHGIPFPFQIILEVKITMMPLVNGGDAKKLGRWASCCS